MPYLGRASSVHIDEAPGRPHPPLPITIRLNMVCSHNLVMKHLPGADPELVLLGHRFEELEVRPWEAGGGRGEAGPGALTPPLSCCSEFHSAT